MTNNRWRRAKRRTTNKAGEMNKTEQAYAEYLYAQRLAGEILGYSFEPIKFRLADKTFYSPDFLVQLADDSLEIHEVKACKANGDILCEDDAKVKIKVAADLYPMFGFVMCGKLPRNGGWRIERIG